MSQDTWLLDVFSSNPPKAEQFGPQAKPYQRHIRYRISTVQVSKLTPTGFRIVDPSRTARRAHILTSTEL
jgi:hypothetical protein